MAATLPPGAPLMEDNKPEQRSSGPSGRQRSIAMWSAGVLVATVVSGLLVWLVSDNERSLQAGNDVPVVKAAESPVKTRPEEPGGMHVPHRDKLIYQRLKGDEEPPVVERISSAPEEPLPPPQSEPDSSAISSDLSNNGDAPPAEFLPTPPEDLALVQPIEEFFDDAVPGAPTAVEPSPESSSVAMVAPRPRPTVPPSAPSGSAPGPQPGLSAEARAAQSLLMGTAAGDYAIQLASVRSRQEASREWERLRRSHADILGNLQLTVLEADLGQRGKYYRLRAGPITNQNSARQACKSLVDRKVACIVVPN